MKSKIFIHLSFFLLSMSILAQKDIPLSLNDLIPGGSSYSKYRPKLPTGLTFFGDKIVYTKGDSAFAVGDKGVKDAALFDLKSLNDVFGKDYFKTMPQLSFPYTGQSIAKLDYNGKMYLFDFVSNRKLATFDIPDEADNADFSPRGKIVAYTKKNNLFVLDKNGKETAVTAETDSGIVCGQAVHRNEFGIMKGTFWSPKGDLLAFYRMDETMVTDYPLVDASTRIATLHNVKYPMAGMKSHEVTVGIFNPETGKTVFLKTGTPKEKYLTNIAWSPDEKYIYIAELNRGQDTMQMKRYDAATGNLEALLFTEIHPKYVEPLFPVIFLKDNPNQFLWLSRRDGYNQFYLYGTSGKLIKQVTSGKWEVSDFVGFNDKGDELLYASDEASPIGNSLYKINLKTGKKALLTPEEGVHKVSMSESGKTICDVFTSQFNPGKVAQINVNKDTRHIFYTAENPFENIKLPEITLGTIKAADGKTDLYYRLVKPLYFDPNKKYPTIIYVYGGPHSQFVTDSWMGQVRGWDIYMAEKGYVVFTVDNRGTSNRGLAFENVTFRHLGVEETKDQMRGVDFLKSLSYVDSNRIGVHGWSFGGFMTLNLMLRHPETFKVGVAGGPVTDWKYYEVMYGERYMDRPQENPDGYEESSMVDKAGNLQGRLLIIHDDQDETVVPQHSIQFLRSCIANGTQPDFFVYPGHKHNVFGQDRIHLYEHITRYFEDFLR